MDEDIDTEVSQSDHIVCVLPALMCINSRYMLGFRSVCLACNAFVSAIKESPSLGPLKRLPPVFSVPC